MLKGWHGGVIDDEFVAVRNEDSDDAEATICNAVPEKARR
jgi:hypothetical protein